MTSQLMLLGLGLLLGVRHAMDPDHIIAISTIVAGEKSVLRAARVGAFWGLGHTTAIFLFGGAIILLGIAIPPALGLSLELAVAFMLIALGVSALLGRQRTNGSSRSAKRPLLVGGMHGLAGSAAAALLVLSVIDSPVAGLVYLLLFGAGTVVGMVLITAAIAAPMQFGAARIPQAHRYLVLASGGISIAFGFLMVHQIGVVDGLLTGAASWTAR